MRSKRSKIAFGVAVGAGWVVLLTLAAIFLLPKLLNKAPEVTNTPQEVIEIAMDAMTGEGTTEPVLLGADGTPVGVAKATGIAGLISEKVTYEVISLEVAENTAQASVQVTAPDTLALVQQALTDMETYDETVFMERMNELLQQKVETITRIVQVELVVVENGWCVVNNAELSDAVTGGMVSRYVQLQQAIIAAMKKEGEE